MVNPSLNKQASPGVKDSFWTKVDGERILLAFFAALVGMDILYRIELAAAIYSKKSKIILIEPTGVAISDFLKAPISDLNFVALLALCYVLAKLRLRDWLPRLAATRLFLAGESIAAFSVLMLIALLMRTHFQLLTQLNMGLTPQLLAMAPRVVGPGDFFRMMRPSDVLFLASPAAIFFWR